MIRKVQKETPNCV